MCWREASLLFRSFRYFLLPLKCKLVRVVQVLLERDSIGQIYSGVNHWASEEEDTIFCCDILAAFFSLTAVATKAHWNKRTLPALVTITEVQELEKATETYKCTDLYAVYLAVLPLSCKCGNFTKYMNICPTTHKKTLSSFKWEQTGKHTLAHRHTQAHTSQVSYRCAIAKYLLNASPVWVGSFPSSYLGPRNLNPSEINRAAAVLFLLSLCRAEHSGRTLGSQLASPTQPSCS